MSNKAYNQDMAKQFAHDEKHIADIIYSKEWETFFIKKGNYYEQQDDKVFRMIVTKYIASNFPNQNHIDATYRDIIKQLKTFTVRQYDSVDTHYIALSDKLLNTDTLELEENDDEKIAIHHIPVHSKDLNQPTPHFTNYLNTTIVQKGDTRTPDQPLIDLVQEMFGFYITPNLKAEAMFFLVGRGSNGKSVMITILEELIGRKYRTAMSIQTLTTEKFSTYSLIGTKLNVCNEEESKHLRADKFKALVTGDTIQVEQKGQDPFPFRPTTKYLFASQNIPNFQEVDGGIMRRIKIIMFNRIFLNKDKDKDIVDKLISELAGILQFAIDGARRLKENNYNFSEPDQLLEALDEFEQELSSPIRFFKENYVIHEDKKKNILFKSKKDLYSDYIKWCEEVNKGKKSKVNFLKDIANQIPFFEDNESRRRCDNGKAERGVFVSRIDDSEYEGEFFEEQTATLDEFLTLPDNF